MEYSIIKCISVRKILNAVVQYLARYSVVSYSGAFSILRDFMALLDAEFPGTSWDQPPVFSARASLRNKFYCGTCGSRNEGAVQSRPRHCQHKDAAPAWPLPNQHGHHARRPEEAEIGTSSGTTFIDKCKSLRQSSSFFACSATIACLS